MIDKKYIILCFICLLGASTSSAQIELSASIAPSLSRVSTEHLRSVILPKADFEIGARFRPKENSIGEKLTIVGLDIGIINRSRIYPGKYGTISYQPMRYFKCSPKIGALVPLKKNEIAFELGPSLMVSFTDYDHLLNVEFRSKYIKVLSDVSSFQLGYGFQHSLTLKDKLGSMDLETDMKYVTHSIYFTYSRLLIFNEKST